VEVKVKHVSPIGFAFLVFFKAASPAAGDSFSVCGLLASIMMLAILCFIIAIIARRKKSRN
jgi:hypothetical protein